MSKFMELDIDNIARIGIMFMDGDSLENILLDAYGQTDYDFDMFYHCKAVIMKIERIDPSLKLTAVMWQLRPDNPDVVVPVVAGKQLPLTGWPATEVSSAIAAAFNGQWGAILKRDNAGTSHYYPIKNSDAEIVGVLELLEDNNVVVDI